MGAITSKFSACLPLGSATGLLPAEFVEDTMEELVSSYDAKIHNCEDNIKHFMIDAINLRKKGKDKEALAKFRRAKIEEVKKSNYEKQRDNIESQLSMSKDRRLTVETMKAMNAHKNLMKKEFGENAVQEAEELMGALKEQNIDMDSINRALSEPMTDTTDIEFEYADDETFLRELDNIAFSQGENVQLPAAIGHKEEYIQSVSEDRRKKRQSSKIEVKPQTKNRRGQTGKKKRQAVGVNREGKEETLKDIIG